MFRVTLGGRRSARTARLLPRSSPQPASSWLTLCAPEAALCCALVEAPQPSGRVRSFDAARRAWWPLASRAVRRVASPSADFAIDDDFIGEPPAPTLEPHTHVLTSRVRRRLRMDWQVDRQLSVEEWLKRRSQPRGLRAARCFAGRHSLRRAGGRAMRCGSVACGTPCRGSGRRRSGRRPACAGAAVVGAVRLLGSARVPDPSACSVGAAEQAAGGDGRGARAETP